MFTRRFFILLGSCIVVALMAMAAPGLLTLAKAMAWILAALTVVDALVTFAASRLVSAKRSHDESFSLNQPNLVKLTIGLSAVDWLARWLRITSFDMPPRTFLHTENEEFLGVGTFEYFVTPIVRGHHEFGAVRIFVKSVLGLFESRRFTAALDDVKVYPTFHHLDKIEMMATARDAFNGTRRTRRAGNNTDFEQIRPYVMGDDIRTINWRATARANALMVNTYTDERSKPVIPVICAGPSMLIATDGISLLDRAASAAVALGSSVVRHYDEAGLITLTHLGVDTYMKPERSTATVSRMLQLTYDFGLPPTDSEQVFISDPDVMPEGIDMAPLYALRHRMNACEADADYDALANFALKSLRRRSLIVLFANFENIEVARQAIPALRRIARKHQVLVILFENEGITKVVNEPYDNPAGVSQDLSEQRFRAVCANYIERQRQLVATLRESGIGVILTPPEKLTAAVIQTYIDYKNRAVI